MPTSEYSFFLAEITAPLNRLHLKNHSANNFVENKIFDCVILAPDNVCWDANVNGAFWVCFAKFLDRFYFIFVHVVGAKSHWCLILLFSECVFIQFVVLK